MAVLNVCLCSNLPPNPKPILSTTQVSSLPSLPTHRIPQGLNQPQASNNLVFSLGESISRASFLALLSASLVFAADPALAFKGGGPYGSEVTRGQDLSGKDFSGKSLIKQDFKTSILRQANFKGAKLLGASFFDSDLTGQFELKMRKNVRKSSETEENMITQKIFTMEIKEDGVQLTRSPGEQVQVEASRACFLGK
ncbi:unnamed protein product [Ilex paraguariensis]|uniref:Uncharacterized protein n=1 Tax=Ilex paraguariensis TaxID=185542 RepID=A0ABC8USB9_9AQUA